MREIEGLVKNGIFRIVDKKDIAPGCDIFGSMFVDEIKKAELGILLKSRLISQRYHDEGSTSIETKAPEAQRFTQRFEMCIAASHRGMKV